MKIQLFKKPFKGPSGNTHYTYWMRITKRNKDTFDVEVGVGDYYWLKESRFKEIPYHEESKVNG